ncbi:PREDICTED: uncharacterized protein LOC103343754 [Prunus mume]|uniref:Uncharacterized protein LOC103343754 n=1 Tax=Prunus mume TaxID=102107 RepID=A0ABM1LZ20_PRUMU|nr:PREDICTED: uncharacterized protein LOC103343754 [Prunus mume]
MVTEAKSNSLGEILLFGNKERLKVGPHIEDIYLNYRVKMLVECLGPVTGWSICFASMIGFLEDCVSHYHIFLENELSNEKEHEGDSEMKEKECRTDTQVIKGKCKSFVEFFRDSFVSTALPLRRCIFTFCTHIAKNYFLAHTFQNMISLIGLFDSIESLLLHGDFGSEALEHLCSCSEVEDVPESFVDNSFLLCMKRKECLSVLRTLQDSLSGLDLPNFRNGEALMEFCFQRASLIFCTASSSYMLHRLAMEPLTIVVIDEAAQLKECESTIPLQLPGVKHAVLVGDECQLPATVNSNVSVEAGFSRSLFERLSSMGHSKHLLNMQYRMHPSISLFPNTNFYNNQILDAPNVKKRSHEKHYLPGSMYGPFSFINVIDGREEKDEDGRSRKNMVEVAIILKILRKLYKEWIVSKQKLSIGVVSPYAAQVVAVQDKLRQRYDKIDGFTVKVKTVDGFQGGEDDIIIVSTVRSTIHQSIDFISKPQRVNVALTRARHCLWILGNERTLSDRESVWKALVLDAKRRQCFFNADEDKDLAGAILEVKKEFGQFDDLLNPDSIFFRSSRWKVLFSDNFLKSFKKLKSIRLKKSVLNLLLKLSTGWRPKKPNVGTICGSYSHILRKYMVEGHYIVCTTDIAKDVKYIQILKVWDLLPLEDIPKLVNRLESILKRYTDDFINRCKEKCLESDLEVPKSWPPSLDIVRFKDLSITENQSDLVGDNDSDGRSYVENSQVSESLLLMKFYSLSSGVVNHLLSDREGRELDLPFEVTDQEMEIILYRKSSFIVGRSGTGKTTVLTMKLFQNEQCYQLAVQGCLSSQNRMVEQSSSATKGRNLHQLFVTVSPKLCFAIKQHVLNLKSFACGGSDSTEKSLIDMADFDEEEAQFKDIKDSFHHIPPNSYPLVITFHKFLMMLDGTLGNSYFERFLDATKLTHGRLQSSRSVALQTFIRTKEVKYERFSSSYWPHFNIQLTKKLDASRVFIEIISHIKGGLGAMDAGDGKLNRDDYVQLSEGRGSNLSKQKREEIYDIFQAYEKMKMENGEFDLADFVIDLHRRLRHEKYGGDQMDFVYIDEVQDLTMSQIALFKHMCINNIDEGFIFSGDTAQTIARGIDFRFQDIRHLFHKKFVLEARSNKLEERKEKGQISKMFHLTQNFRTHAGILKLSQSIIELIYHFFPHSIDVLDPETSLIYGEAPVLLESGENENAIIKIFGNSATGTGNIVGFGAEQVILVRDDGARKDVSMFVGKHALVLTIVECKGLEFQDVLLYNFFGSSPLKNQWRVIYDYMKERDLLDSTLPKGFPSFNEARHNILCSELKQLYVAVTRTRQRLWVCENVEELSKPMFDYWKKKCLVQVRQLDDSLAQAMQVASSPEEWKSRGIKLYHEHNYEMATMCFERGGDTYWERRSKAAGLKAIADRMRTSNLEEANSILREAAEIFDAIGKADSAARCFSDLGEYERAARIYLDKCGVPDLERAGECFSLAGCYKDAADVYARGNYFFECLTVCSKGKLFQMGLQYIKYWKQHAIEDGVVARRGEGIDKIEQEYLESCASHYYELKDNRSMMNFVKAFHSIVLMRNFLKKLGLLDELLLLEEEFGNYLEAADIAKLKGDILLEAGFLGKAGKFKEASLHILFYVLANSLWSHGRKGWPIQQFSQKEEHLSKAKSFAKNETESFYELVCTEIDILLNEQSNLAFIKNYMNLYHEHNYEMATMCFERGGDTYWERRSKAAGLKAIADRMRTSNLEEANSILREAAEIFDAIGKADSAARCFSDLGEYERAARIYLDKCGVPDLERAGECFSLAGCYKDAADVYARGNYFFECLTVCSKGKLFQMGLQYIKYWKQHAIEDGVVARRGEGIDKIEQEYLESCASHYYELKDNRSMMNFVKAFHSIVLMRNFLKKLGLLDELLLLEEEFGNYLEAADIAKLKGDILLEAGFLGKAGKFKEASLHILFYVLANSLWSHGRKGWPIQQFSQKEEHLSKAKSFAKNETESFYELVCTEVDILLNEQSNLAFIKNYMNVCQRHKSTRGELLSARKILDAHISSSANKYVWEKDLVDGDLIMCSEGRISENQVSIDSLIYFWIFWKDKIAFIIEYLGCLENQDPNDYRRYGELCLDYLGVWRLYHNFTPVYVLLISDADWVRGLDKRHFRNHGKLVSISVHQLVSAARSYWSSEMLSVGMKVLEKLENLYKFPIKNADDAVFCQSRCLTHICEISEYLLQSNCLKLRNQDTERLQRCVKFSTDTVVANIFPLDWRNSLRENMIALRRTDALKNVLKQVIVEHTSSKKVLSFGQIGRLAMVILGSGKLNNSELYEKLVVKLDCHPPWKAFIENLCENIGPGNTSEEPREVSIMLKLYGALVDTYNANWRVVRDYISPGCFLYLVERLLISATCFQGYAVTTSSCFVEWLMYQEEDTNLSSIVGGDVQQSLIDILHFVIYVVQGCLFNKADMVEWIKKTDANWKNNYSQLMLRFVVVLCLVYLNFDMGLDELYDLLGRDYITEQLPWEFFDALKSGRRHKSLNINTRLLAAAFQKIGNTLVIASFGSDCSRFLCSDVIFVDMKANHSRDYILRKLFPKRPPVLQVSQATSVEAGGNNSFSRVLHATNSNYEEGKSSKILPSNSGVVEPFEPGAVSDKTSDDAAGGRDSHNTDEECCISKESNPKSKRADAMASGSNEIGNKGKKKGKNKKPKKKGGKK